VPGPKIDHFLAGKSDGEFVAPEAMPWRPRLFHLYLGVRPSRCWCYTAGTN